MRFFHRAASRLDELMAQVRGFSYLRPEGGVIAQREVIEPDRGGNTA